MSDDDSNDFERDEVTSRSESGEPSVAMLMALLEQVSRQLEQLSPQLTTALFNIRKLSHPAFEGARLDELRKQVTKQQETSAKLRELYQELHHDLMWLRKHVGSLHTQLSRLGLSDTE